MKATTKNISIITCDLDGTLLNSFGQLSKQSKDTLNKLIKSDILFIPFTARGHKVLMTHATHISDYTNNESGVSRFIEEYILD